MRLSWAAAAGTLLALVLILPACGEERTSAAEGTGSSAKKPASDAGPPKAAPANDACSVQLHGFLASLNALRDKLARGLNYDDYLHEVRGARLEYDRIQAAKLPLGCLLASGGRAERAFNLYIDAANTWGDCLATVSCSTASIEPKLQRKWKLAAAELSAAQRGLRAGRRG
jgi:hypothetical protein